MENMPRTLKTQQTKQEVTMLNTAIVLVALNLLAGLSPATVHAEIYQYIGANGTISLTNATEKSMSNQPASTPSYRSVNSNRSSNAIHFSSNCIRP